MSIRTLTLVAVVGLAVAFGPTCRVPRASRGVAPAPPRPPAVVAFSSDVTPDVRGAIARSLPFLARDGLAWMAGTIPVQDGKGCVSCHHVGYAVWSHNEAARAGVAVPRQQVDALETEGLEFVSRPGKARVVSSTQFILGRDPEHLAEDPGARYRVLLEQVEDSRQDDGSWRARGQFPTQRRPVEESDAVASLWALLALSSLDRGVELAVSNLERGVAWMTAAQPGRSTEWIAARLAVAQALGQTEATDAMRRRLLDQQNDDGGWAWAAGEPSNAFSTGQSLYALGRAAESQDRAAVERAWRYLLERQGRDGTWSTPSELVSDEHGEAKDYIYRYWGTAWATLGLARSLVGAAAELR